MLIRPTHEADSKRLVSLLAQMGYTLSEKDILNRLKAFKVPTHQILVAEEAGVVVGVIAFGCYEHLRLNGSCCHIDTLVVDEACRGKGIGKRLIKAVEEYANRHGIMTIELITSNRRRESGTHAFYEGLDYKDQRSLDYTYFAKKQRL